MNHSDRHPHLINLCLALLLLGSATASQAETEEGNNRYNVLFIAVDDLRPELGCYGQDYVRTPHIDKLASTGTTFLQHFVAVPTCGASRYALLAGRSPLESGIRGGQNSAFYTGPTALKKEQQPGAQSMPELFNRSGYHTVLIGKISHSPDGKVTNYDGTGEKRPEIPGAWDDFATPYGPWERGWGAFFAYADGKHREDGGGHRDLLEFTAEKDTDLPDGLMAETAVAKLKELKNKDEPFFMGLGFYKPHLPFVAPRQDWDAVASWDVPAPVFPQGMDSRYRSGSGEFYSYTTPWKKTPPLSPEAAMQAKRGYLACVRYIDRQIGKVLAALENEGLTDSTIVVLWGDHGWFLGEGAMWGKHNPLETAVHSPLIIRAPGVAPQNRKTDAVVSTMDLYPTLIDLCQPTFTKTEYPLYGESLTPILTGRDEGARRIAVSTWNSATTYRTRSKRVIGQNRNGQWTGLEVYDLSRENGAYMDTARGRQDEARKFLESLLNAQR